MLHFAFINKSSYFSFKKNGWLGTGAKINSWSFCANSAFVTWCDVTNDFCVHCASLSSCMFGSGNERANHGSGVGYFTVNQLYVSIFFLPKVISNLLISLKVDWERIFEVRSNECWNVFGRVIGRSFDHIFDRISNTYVWMFTCLFENVIWTIHSVETPVWRSVEDFLTSTRSSVCLGRLLDVWWFPW